VARRLTWLDVFTSRPLTGNGLAVVHHADGIDDATMLAFARETKLSETTFVQTATEPGADYRNRIWTIVSELPFAGHPSLGTAVAVAHARAEREAHYVQQTGAGLQSVDVELGASGVARASMLQEPAVFGDEIEPERVLSALGLDLADGHSELPPQVVSTGLAHLMIPVRDEAVLNRARPDNALLDALLRDLGVICAYLAAYDPVGEAAQARGYFAADGMIVEDPATGSAAGPLCAYLHARTGADRVDIVQGEAMGRPSRLMCEAGERVRVAGDVVLLAEGEIEL
jgi:trans-2,3-dihydro-3-hydroxyanthranilate isomerase